MTGDGIADVLLGAVDGILVLSGASGAALFTTPTSPTELSGAGDIDGDGYADVLAGGGGALATIFSTTGLPPGSAEVGSGCPGSGGVVPRIGATGGNPSSAAGNPSFGLRVWRALGGATALVLLGASSSNWGGMALPLDLGPFGAPGCSLLVSPDVVVVTTTSGTGPGTGAGNVSIPVPVDPALSGAILYAQGYVIDPGPLPIPGATTAGVSIFIP
jgi:hypothetical protein